MSLGDYVRLVKAYVDVFGLVHPQDCKVEDKSEEGSSLQEDERIMRLCADLKVSRMRPFSCPPNYSSHRGTKISLRT